MGTRLNFCVTALFCISSTTVVADHPGVAFGIGGAGPITTISANPVPVGSWGFGIQTEIINNHEFSTEQLEDFAARALAGVHSVDQITGTSFSLAYGITEDLSVSVRLPYIKRVNTREGELEGSIPEAHTHGDSSGFGDLLVLGQYRVSNSSATDVSVLFGLKSSTGETHDNDDEGARFETEFQPGTGSWDFLLGGAISKNSGNFGYHGNILYNKTTQGSQATEIGDALAYNAALTYRLNSHDHASHDHSTHHSHDNEVKNNNLKWELLFELNGETRRKNRISGVSAEHSGGNTIFLSPGVRVSSGKGRFGGFLSLGIPVVEDQNGKQTDTDQRIVTGISLAF